MEPLLFVIIMDDETLFFLEIKNIRSDLVDVDIEGVHTNIVMVKILKANLTATELCYRLSQASLLLFQV